MGFAQTLDNLDNLVQIPSGCGEQNMIGSAPNLVAAHYLISTGASTADALYQRAVANIKLGFQRQLNYRYDDGSFDAFANDPSGTGSLWLTSFVVRVFGAAASLPGVFIDSSVLGVSIDYLHSQQLSSGAFPNVGTVIHTDMEGGATQGPVTLTAYVLAALVQADDPS